MAGSVMLQSLCCITVQSPNCYKNQSLAFTHSQFFSSNSSLRLKKQSLLSAIRIKRQRTQNHRFVVPIAFASQSNFFNALQTAWKVGRDGVEAGTNLVPNSVPRPVARVSVTMVALTLSLFVLKSFLSTAFFVLATMGLVYFIFIALNNDGGPRSGGTTSTPKEDGMDDSLEEARRIMEKYK
ncbi:uncharacterized protein LOC103960411 isoform X1 [Pyrus x bretschneideri]|uniref:uncharacterized protein LOC103960411 isoform X1 n=1 Tax=Pyrus x bretschneideri TaxID=225117 RepID=UPI00202FBB58|nr:uncharacterized protein LOC103960411 isoform X1 [Pyrus x bretschneideri]